MFQVILRDPGSNDASPWVSSRLMRLGTKFASTFHEDRLAMMLAR
jgi:hypothetical protein